MKRLDANDRFMLLGAVLLVAGIAQKSIAGAFIVAGLLLLVYGIVRDVIA